MKATEKAALQAVAFGVVAGGAFAWFVPEATWWVPIALGALVAGAGYSQIIKDKAAERIANGEVGSNGNS